MAGSLAVEKLNKMGKASGKMSALEIAALGKQLASGEQMTGLQMDADDADWKEVVTRAKSKGPGSWFASKVDFTLNGAHFLGKVGYSVYADVVPLFDGAALDLGGAGLEAVNPKKAEPNPALGSPASYKNWIVGTGGLLVLAPVGADNVVPVRTGEVVITEKGLTAQAEKPMEFRMGNKTVRSERMDFSDQVAVLYDVKVLEDGVEKEGKYRTEAALDGEGLCLFERPVQEAEPGEEPQPAAFPEREQGIMGNLADGVADLAGQQEMTPILLGNEKESEEDDEDAEGFGARIDLQKGDITLGYEKGLLDSEEDGDDDGPIWDQVKDAAKDMAKDVAKDALLKILEDGIRKGDWAAVEQIFTEKWEEAKAIYDGFTSKELIDSWKLFPDTIKSIFRDRLPEEDVKSYMEKLVPTGPISQFLGMNDNEEQTADEKEEGGSKRIILADIPIFPPFIDFSVGLKPAYKFSAYFVADAENLYGLWKEKEDTPTNLAFRAGIRASLSLTADAALAAQIPFIIKGYGNIWAKAALDGAGVSPGGECLKIASGKNTALEIQAKLPLIKASDGSIKQAGNMDLDILGGFTLKGSVGASVGISSTILMWEKTLWEKTFGEWNLLAMALHLGVTKEATDSFLSGWSLSEASIKIAGPGDGIGEAFLDQNTPGRKYGLYDPNPVSSREYEDIETNFLTAVRLLRDYAGVGDSSTERSLLMPAEEAGENQGGPADQVLRMMELQKEFLKVWVSAQNELEKMEEYLEALDNSKKEKRTLSRAEKAAKMHSERIEHMNTWAADSGVDVMMHYIAHPSKAGSGYLKDLDKQAMEEAITYEGIVDYERKRYSEKTKGMDERLALIQDMERQGKSNKEIYEAYKKKGGKQALKNKAFFENTDALRVYEQSRLDITSKKPKERLEKVRGIEDNFFKEYVKLLSQEELLLYGNTEWLLEYEKKALKKHGNKGNVEDYFTIQGQLALLESGATDDSARLIDQFRKKKKKKTEQKVPALSEIFGEEIYRTASVDDLIEMEFQKYVKGELGILLEQYREANPQAADRAETLDQIFGDEKGEALKKVSGYVDKAERADLAHYLTIELLMEYVNLLKQDKRTQEQAARQYQYLYRGLVKVEASPEKKRREVEEEYIVGFFERFDRFGVEEGYKEAFKKGTVANLSLMTAGFEDGSDHQRYQWLLEAKEKGISDYQILEEYLDKDGLLQGDKEDIIAYQREKGDLSLEDAKRFYESRLHDDTNHLSRYEMIARLYSRQVPYDEILKQYEGQYQGGKGFSEAIKGKLKNGKRRVPQGTSESLQDITLTKDEVLQFETERFERKTQKHTKRLALIDEMKAEGKSYQEILGAYENLARHDGTGLVAKAKTWLGDKKIIQFRTGFNKKLKEREYRTEELIAYEEMRKQQAGAGHAARLRALLGLNVDASDFMSAPLLSDEAERGAKRAEYLKHTKRFKKSKELKQQAELKSDELLNRPDEVMKQSILDYEERRRKFYDDRVKDIREKHEKVRRMRDRLREMTKMCNSITNNLKDILTDVRKRPDSIFEKLKIFEESAVFTMEHRGKEKDAVAGKDQILSEAAEAAERLEEANRQTENEN